MTKPNVFVCADWHLGHRRITEMTEPDGRKRRPWNTPDEMDEALIANHNAVVKPSDKVYVLGDAVINRRCLPTIGRMNGRKILVKGNHDNFRLEEYAEYFEDIKGCHVMDDFILTHIPVHEREFPRFKGNIHGHLHGESVLGRRWYRDHESEWNFVIDTVDTRYLCVSMEQINYTPIAWEDAIKKWEGQG